MKKGFTIRVAEIAIDKVAEIILGARHRKGMSGQHGGDDPSESEELHFAVVWCLKKLKLHRATNVLFIMGGIEEKDV